ncbi:MAG: ATP-binding protein [Acidobacteriota bacterium]|nr:ATP-binding protein [Acidobacteriota bacterium]
MPFHEDKCPLCGDTGWAVSEEGGVPVARRCSCLEGRRAGTLLEAARIPRRYRDCSLDNFKPMSPRQNDALKTARKFINDFPARNAGLLFIGPCGVGKTHLAAAILKEIVVQKAVPGLFYDFRDLIRDIQATYTPDSDLNESDVLAPVFQSRILVLDELGAKRSTAWVEDTVFSIINYRYNRQQLTLFTSNFLDTADVELAAVAWKNTDLTKKEETLVDRIGPRLRSRLYEMCKIVDIDGEDFRRNVKQASYR